MSYLLPTWQTVKSVVKTAWSTMRIPFWGFTEERSQKPCKWLKQAVNIGFKSNVDQTTNENVTQSNWQRNFLFLPHDKNVMTLTYVLGVPNDNQVFLLKEIHAGEGSRNLGDFAETNKTKDPIYDRRRRSMSMWSGTNCVYTPCWKERWLS